MGENIGLSEGTPRTVWWKERAPRSLSNPDSSYWESEKPSVRGKEAGDSGLQGTE